MLVKLRYARTTPRHPSIKERLQRGVSSIAAIENESKGSFSSTKGKREKWKETPLAALEIGGQQNESARRKLKWSMLLLLCGQRGEAKAKRNVVNQD